MKRILIDLDVVTVAIWDKKEDAIEFINRIASGEFILYTPFILLDLVGKWKHQKLREQILNFYDNNSDVIITTKSYEEKIIKIKVDDKKLTKELLSSSIKEEDVLLIIFTSIFDLDYLVTFNRKHLLGKAKIINEVLKKYGIKTIKIVSPKDV